jgi:hypothetical protein
VTDGGMKRLLPTSPGWKETLDNESKNERRT